MRIALLIAVAFATSVSYAQTKTPAVTDFQGRWMVSEVVGYADMGSGVKHAKALLGKVMVISADKITFEGDACKPNTGFRVVEVDTASDLRAKSGASREDAELPAKAALLESDNCTEVYWLNSRKIEFDDEGIFVRAYRQ
jgi:hypothetical protein